MTLAREKQDHCMSVSVTPELEQFVRELLESGKFSSASEVICEGLKLLQDRYIVYQTRLTELKQEIAIGIEQADRGELIDGEEVFAELEEDTRQIEAEIQQASEVA
jgi:antitoxin ParD1/3/4